MKKKTSVLLFIIIFMIAAALFGGFFSLFLTDTSPINAPGNSSGDTSGIAPETETEQEGENIIKAAEQILPSVVGIVSTGITDTEQQGKTTVLSSGSGVIIDERGYIVTNRHVIADAKDINVIFHDSSEEKATIVGSDRRTDLALLKVTKDNLKAAVFTEALPKIGETAIAVGSPGGTEFSGTVTKGIISGLDRHLITDDGSTFSLIQTDAAINPGNSGGALCNKNGEVIGINTIKITESGFEGMGFSIPSQTVKDTVTDLLDYGTVQRGALGIYLILEVTEEIAADYDLGTDYGVMIQPQQGSAAEKAGLRDYDIIVGLDGQRIDDTYTLQQTIFSHRDGDTVTLDIYRGKQQLQIAVTLEQLKDE